jgi:hypothetical protein
LAGVTGTVVEVVLVEVVALEVVVMGAEIGGGLWV